MLYQNGDPGTVGVLSTPLLLYHVEQLILGNIEVELLKKWVKRGQEEGDDATMPDPRDEEDNVSETRIGPQSALSMPSNLKLSAMDDSRAGGSTMTLHNSYIKENDKIRTGSSTSFLGSPGGREQIDTPTTAVEITVSPPDTPVKQHFYH